MRYFLLLNNYLTLGLSKHVFLIKSDIRDFFVRSGNVWKVRHNYLTSWFNLLYLFLELSYKCISYNDIFFMTLGLRFFVVPCITYGNNVWKLRFVFIRHCDVFFISSNYIIYLFDLVTIFDNIRVALYFGTFELRMEMTWKLRFIFVRHCDVFFILLQLRYLFVRCSYVFRWR